MADRWGKPNTTVPIKAASGIRSLLIVLLLRASPWLILVVGSATLPGLAVIDGEGTVRFSLGFAASRRFFRV